MELQRDAFKAILANLDYPEILLLTGPRQVGKTTVMHQTATYLAGQKQPVFWLNLEDPEYLNLLNQSPKKIFELLPINLQKRSYVFIDEVQYLANPSNFLKYLYDEYKNKIKLLVSGSSAFYLDKKFKDSLAGRKKLLTIYSLNFREFLRFKGVGELTGKTLSQKEPLDLLYGEYLIWGGYPKVVLAAENQEKEEILKELIYSYVKKDIFEANIRQDEDFYRLFKILAGQIGNLVNGNELAATLGLSKTAVDNYLYVLQKSFHIKLVRPWFKNLRKELTRMPKVYFTDPGIRNFLVNDLRPFMVREDKGQLLENGIFRQLVDRYGGDSVKFWRTVTKKEVDFVLEKEQLAYEVKTGLSHVNKKKYQEFIKQYPDFKLEFISRQNWLELTNSAFA